MFGVKNSINSIGRNKYISKFTLEYLIKLTYNMATQSPVSIPFKLYF